MYGVETYPKLVNIRNVNFMNKFQKVREDSPEAVVKKFQNIGRRNIKIKGNGDQNGRSVWQ